MSRQKPENVEEWVDHILNVIHVDDLLHQARVIATATFQRRLEEEGYDGADLLAIYRAVALRFVREKIRLPSEISGSSVNYLELSKHDVPPDIED